MATPRKGIVYTLSDPRDGAIRYVGKTTKAPLERLAQHLSSPTNPAMRVWLTGLGSQGLLPKMDTIATVAAERLDAEESKQIAKHAKAHRLLNSPYYQANIADLWNTPAAGKPPAGPRQPSRLDAAAAALQLRLYGRIAAARAREELPSYAVFFRTLLLAPVLLIGVVTLALTKTWLGRRLLAASLIGWYLWHIGFDHAIRALVLAHLPVAQTLAFWHEYLAVPIRTFGLHVAAFAVLAAWVSYLDIAKATRSQRVEKPRPATAGEVATAAGRALEGAVLSGPPSPLVAELTRPRNI